MRKVDKIYFDIDGVLRGCVSPKEDIVALLRYALDNYPGKIYWLTSYCRGGQLSIYNALKNEFNDEFVTELCNSVQIADFDRIKSDALDMDSGFVWFDDNLFESDRQVLEDNRAMNGFFRMDPRDPKMAKKALGFLKSSGERY